MTRAAPSTGDAPARGVGRRPRRGAERVALGLGASIVLTAVLTALLWGVFGAFAVRRFVVLDLEFAAARAPAPGETWSLEWRDEATGRGSGVWLDPPAASARSTLTRVRQRLPSTYGVDTLTLRWRGAPSTEVRIARLEAWSETFDRRREIALSDAAIGGGGVAGPGAGAGVQSFRTGASDGAISWRRVGPASWAGAHALGWSLVAASIVAGAWLAWGLTPPVTRVAEWMGGRIARSLPGRTLAKAPWRAIAIVAAVGAPLWMTLWAPMLIFADGTAYILQAATTLATGSLDHLDGWRLPGYQFLIIPFLASMRDYAVGVGWAQAALGAATAWLAFAILRPRLPRPWPHAAMLLVALDPAGLLLQRCILAETLGTFLLMLGAWLFAVGAPWVAGPGRPWRWTVARGAALGVVCAVAAYARGNLQLLVPAFGAGIAITAWAAGARLRGLVPAAACVAVAAGCLAPLVARNARVFGVPSVAVGSNFARGLFGWQNGTTDPNQTAALSDAEHRALRAREARGMSDWDFHWWLATTGTIPTPPGTHPWTAIDRRAAVINAESLARAPERFAENAGLGVLSLLGWPVQTPSYSQGGTTFMASAFRGIPDESMTTNFIYERGPFTPGQLSLFDRTTRPIAHLRDSPNAAVFDRLWAAARLLRPFVAALFLLTIFRLARERDWPLLTLAGLVVGNAVAIAALTLATEDRFGMVHWPLMTTIAVYGAGRIFSCRDAAPPRPHAASAGG